MVVEQGADADAAEVVHVRRGHAAVAVAGADVGC